MPNAGALAVREDIGPGPSLKMHIRNFSIGAIAF